MEPQDTPDGLSEAGLAVWRELTRLADELRAHTMDPHCGASDAVLAFRDRSVERTGVL